MVGMPRIGEFTSEMGAVSSAARGIAAFEDPAKSMKRGLHGTHSTVERYTSFIIQRRSKTYSYTRATLTGFEFSGAPKGATALVTGPGRFNTQRQAVNSTDLRLLRSAGLERGYLLIYQFDSHGNYLKYSIESFG